jgi:Uma2 family endonuclease
MSHVIHHWTAAERGALPEDGNRYEVLDGELFVTPAPSWPHQRAVAHLQRILSDYLSTHRVGDVLFAPADVVFSQTRAVQPDIFVVPLVEDRPPNHFDEVGRLLLAVEVSSPSTARADRVTKRVIYSEERVDEYWIVDLDARTFERTTPSEARAEVLPDKLVWSPAGALVPLVIDLPAYFASVLGGADDVAS